MLAAVLGLSLTVVAIVVQLASQRYSPKIIDLFMSDGTNLRTFVFMVVSCIYVVMLPTFSSSEELPSISVLVGLALTVANFGVLLPYFGYVFAFLHPNNVITKIEDGAQKSLVKLNSESDRKSIEEAQNDTSAAIERISDNCLAAVNQTDRSLALHSIRTLETLLVRYQGLKAGLPAAWSQATHDHFFTLSMEFHEEIVRQAIWVEAKALMEFEHVMKRALDKMDGLVSQLASSTRRIGIAALDHDDNEALGLVLRFFNTYIRHSLNARKVRAVYNILYQYRMLAVKIMAKRPEIGARAAQHLVYYGRLANDMGLPFVTVTVAHDVRIMCEEAFKTPGLDVKPLLSSFLLLDQLPEGQSEELALVGVRKAQSILGAFFIHHGGDSLARQIQDDMAHESQSRLFTIREEILSVQERRFWEITDRGFNFDYVEPELRPEIQAFFEPMLKDDPSDRSPM